MRSNLNSKCLFAALFLSTIICVQPGLTQDYQIKTFKITIEGTSTLHDWISDVTKLEFAGNLFTEGTKLREIKEVFVKIPVESIKSTKGKIMDNKTWEAFKYDKYPAITYKLITASVQDGLLRTSGTLTLAGASQPVSMEVPYTVMPSGDIRLTGLHKVKMPDYKMNPPTAMMGTIKVGEEVTVRFDLTITPKK